MDTLKKEAEAKIEELKQLDKQLLSIIPMIDFEDYELDATINYDRVVFTIAHKEFNWNNFLTVTITPNPRGNAEAFDFSHGSGGFHNCTVNDRLNATVEMFKLVEIIQNHQNVISLAFRDISVKEAEFRILQNKLALEEKAIKKDAFIKELRKTHRPIVIVDDFINSLKDPDNKKVELSSVYYDTCKSEYTLVSQTLENISTTNRLKLRTAGMVTSKQSLKDYLDRVDNYIKM